MKTIVRIYSNFFEDSHWHFQVDGKTVSYWHSYADAVIAMIFHPTTQDDIINNIFNP